MPNKYDKYVNHARACLARDDVPEALKAYEACCAELGGKDLKEVDINLALCACKFFLSGQTGEMTEIEEAGNELSGAIFCCRKAALAMDERDMDFIKQIMCTCYVNIDGMSERDMVIKDNGGRVIGALDAESLFHIAGLVHRGVKARLKGLQFGDSKQFERFRSGIARDMRDYMLVCQEILIEYMGISDDLQRKLYERIADLDACSAELRDTVYTLYGKGEKKISVKKKMSEIYKLLHRVNPRLRTILILLSPFIIFLLIYWFGIFS